MPRKRKNKMYFTQDVEDAIIEYNNETDEHKKREIYNERIKYALNKLVENVINTFKFPYIDESFRNKKAEVVSHLMLNIDRFTEEKGKAYSYFTVIARNYLIIQNDSSYKSLKTDSSIDRNEYDSEEYSNVYHQLEDPDYLYYNTSEDKEEFINLMIKFFDKNMLNIFNKKRDIDIANSLLILMREYKSIENFNKKNLYILVRELSNYHSTYITKVINKMKSIYSILYNHYNEYGDIPRNYYNLHSFLK